MAYLSKPEWVELFRIFSVKKGILVARIGGIIQNVIPLRKSYLWPEGMELFKICSIKKVIPMTIKVEVLKCFSVKKGIPVDLFIFFNKKGIPLVRKSEERHTSSQEEWSSSKYSV